MSQRLQTERVAGKPSQGHEHTVLRLAREALRQDPPRIQFVGRSGRAAAQGALPWRAFD
ncbi:MAG TPA: hypothetical protein VFS30_17640 [Dehalococcoidia bacterium]|nr:hypothetical protein [Dehalococcoidia bacterium]